MPGGPPLQPGMQMVPVMMHGGQYGHQGYPQGQGQASWHSLIWTGKEDSRRVQTLGPSAWYAELLDGMLPTPGNGMMASFTFSFKSINWHAAFSQPLYTRVGVY